MWTYSKNQDLIFNLKSGQSPGAYGVSVKKAAVSLLLSN